jgi:hypothetical protein
MRKKLQLQSIKTEHYQHENKDLEKVKTAYLNEDAVWKDYQQEQLKLENFNKLATEYKNQFYVKMGKSVP